MNDQRAFDVFLLTELQHSLEHVVVEKRTEARFTV